MGCERERRTALRSRHAQMPRSLRPARSDLGWVVCAGKAMGAMAQPRPPSAWLTKRAGAPSASQSTPQVPGAMSAMVAGGSRGSGATQPPRLRQWRRRKTARGWACDVSSIACRRPGAGTAWLTCPIDVAVFEDELEWAVPELVPLRERGSVGLGVGKRRHISRCHWHTWKRCTDSD